MPRSGAWTIGSFRGVTFRLHLNLIFFLIYLGFAIFARFDRLAHAARMSPETLSLPPLSWAILLPLGYLASLLVHEGVHAVLATRAGIPIHSTTLTLLGGVSTIERADHVFSDELKMAIAGPLTHFALAAVFFLLKFATPWPDVALLGFWLGAANLALGLIHLLPALPLDGGRALRSMLAERMGIWRATQASVRMSRIIAFAIGAWGLVAFSFLPLLLAFFHLHLQPS